MLVSRFMTRRPVTVAPDAPLEEAIALMERHGFRHLPVATRGEVLGMLSDRDLRLATGLQPSQRRLRNRHGLKLPGAERVAEVMRRPVHCLPERASSLRAAQDMLRLGIGAIPVTAEGCLVGILTETDLLRDYLGLCGDSREGDVLAQSHMHAPLPTVEPEASIEEALDALDPRIGHLCLCEGERLTGIVSERDLRLGLACSSQRDARVWSERRLDHWTARVREFATTRVITAAPDTPLAHCAARMLDHKISALPILAGEHALGLLTQRDILLRYTVAAATARARGRR